MDTNLWVLALSPTALLLCAAWLARNLIITRLKESVRFEFNSKLEELGSALRNSEEALKAETRSRESDVLQLRSGAMSALASRQIALDSRRLEAVDQLWSSIAALAPAKILCKYLVYVKFEVAVQEAEKNPAAREMFKAMGSGCDIRTLDLSGAGKAHPYVSPLVWSTYSAYLAVASDAMIRMEVLKSGVRFEKPVDQKRISDLVATALPHYSSFIEENGPSGYYMLLDDLEEKLLKDIDQMMQGVEADQSAIERAAKILKKSKEAMPALSDPISPG